MSGDEKRNNSRLTRARSGTNPPTIDEPIILCVSASVQISIDVYLEAAAAVHQDEHGGEAALHVASLHVSIRNHIIAQC